MLSISLIDLALLLLLALVTYFWIAEYRSHREDERQHHNTLDCWRRDFETQRLVIHNLRRRPIIHVSGPGARIIRVPNGNVIIEFALSMN